MNSADTKIKFPGWGKTPAAWVLPAVFIVALLFHSDLAPLEETHWDEPIYVGLSKWAAETDMLSSFHKHAHEIKLGPIGEHWNFTRIGHILLLGIITELAGSSEAALSVMQWLYRVFMALGVTLCIVLSFQLVALCRATKPDSFWWTGYLIAALTYVASDSYRGLQGHMLSEPPAFLALTSFAVILLKAIELRSLVISVFSGILLFLVFFIRIDTILPAAVFLTILLVALVMLRKFDAIPYIITAGLVSLAFYVVYAWWFSPLVDHRTLANFSSAVKEIFPGVPFRSLFAIVIAGGMLWVGACTAVLKWREPHIKFAFIWLGVALLPMVIDSLNGRAIEVRMAFFIVMPLIVLSGEGWRWMLLSFKKQRKAIPLAIAIGLIVILMFVPYWPMRKEIRNLTLDLFPQEAHKYLFISAARFGSVSPPMQDDERDSKIGFLVRPRNERLTLEYSKAREIGDFLYIPKRPAYLLMSGTDIALGSTHSNERFLNLLRYFGSKYPENADFVVREFPNNSVGKSSLEPCKTRVPSNEEPIAFCSSLVLSDIEMLREKNIPLYILHVDGNPFPDMPQLKLEVLLSSPPYTLYGIAQ
ncbi:MAG: hypothetical protein JSR51_06610 [Proteobacteria bacterium]|nr:hypothetical protein [Pseudomonadota bacterium]